MACAGTCRPQHSQSLDVCKPKFLCSWGQQYHHPGGEQEGTAGGLPYLLLNTGVFFYITKGNAVLSSLVYRKICATIFHIEDKGVLAKLGSTKICYNDKYNKIPWHGQQYFGPKVDGAHCQTQKGEGQRTWPQIELNVQCCGFCMLQVLVYIER